MKDTAVWTEVYHDSSTKGFRHDIGHKRHDCWRGGIRHMAKIDGKWQQVIRIRKRFKCRLEAQAWVAQMKNKAMS